MTEMSKMGEIRSHVVFKHSSYDAAQRFLILLLGEGARISETALKPHWKLLRGFQCVSATNLGLFPVWRALDDAIIPPNDQATFSADDLGSRRREYHSEHMRCSPPSQSPPPVPLVTEDDQEGELIHQICFDQG